LKDMISEFIWYFLGGLLAYSVSQINIIDGACDKGVQKDREFDSGEAEEAEEAEVLN